MDVGGCRNGASVSEWGSVRQASGEGSFAWDLERYVRAPFLKPEDIKNLSLGAV
jgi:hypothetical protein